MSREPRIERRSGGHPAGSRAAATRAAAGGFGPRPLPSLLLAVLALFVVACEPTNRGYAPVQPVAYSHAVHAGALRIPCQYCHSGAERGRYAGIPPAQVCMNCHVQVRKDHPEVVKVKQAIAEGRPIEWVRIHRLPDHATFDHSIHVKKGVACQTCHGPVEAMGKVEQFAPLTMGWCIDCHRQQGADPRIDVVPASMPPTDRAPVRANRLTDCGVCHH